MTLRRINARDIIVQVRAADGVTWLGIKDLTSIVPKPGESEETAETTTVDSAGNAEEEIMQRGYAMDIEALKVLDHLTGAPDPGQARCEDLATKVGYESLGALRFRHPLDAVWKVWAEATFSPGDQGGGVNDKGAWKFTVKRSGPTTTMTAP
ncbi:MAG TPA: hypothetical protein VM677_27190 [Actinokineospora sp.]|jgi:hypothetical protein|nr:hypothetical protein [Actinokineospora sp.]